ncbi:B12-binding domain-containing radical SAM protein [Caloranaerobacter ferrireducens]|uniref:B12-binding domain-containing radical SAM protein n=1 Tax=Caloranaerobacter ferrireducens TaxID=1323370 RepID=UPI00084D52E0|nr:radical SAM protein [Caloranaerobacter ferrireducens]
MGKTVLLIGFYNEKALGVRYLANYLKKHGYIPHILFFKEFNSIKPSKASSKELDLLEELIKKIEPSYIGLSVMSSLYLESVYLVNNRIKEKFNIPIIWGGVYPTLFPERALKHCDFVIRGEGEEALVELLNKLEENNDLSDIRNLAFINESGEIIINEVRPLIQDLDSLGYPEIGGYHKYYIFNNELKEGDPQLRSMGYELTASRGCPFACSYCSSINIKRLYLNKGRFIRFRSVDSVMKELNEAKEKIKNLKFVHFWDEIFPDDEEWIEEFKERYKKEIGLPFKIWGHPLKIRKSVIENLVEAGLYQIVVGIQSGSLRVRKEIFRRTETQEQIIRSSKILSECKVPRVIYDFMLKHPFETVEDLKETYKLCLKLEPPFELQLHGLNFLPGTDIVQMAIKRGLLTEDELEKIMYSSIQEQYDMYWGPASNRITENNVWISLIYLTQFSSLRPFIKVLSNEIEKGNKEKVVVLLQKVMKKISKFRNFISKVKLVLNYKM